MAFVRKPQSHAVKTGPATPLHIEQLEGRAVLSAIHEAADVYDPSQDLPQWPDVGSAVPTRSTNDCLAEQRLDADIVDEVFGDLRILFDEWDVRDVQSMSFAAGSVVRNPSRSTPSADGR
jgi:hypothetical protein